MGYLGDKSGAALCKEILEREPNLKISTLQMRAAIAAGSIGDPELLPILRKIVAEKKYGTVRFDALTSINDIECKVATKIDPPVATKIDPPLLHF